MLALLAAALVPSPARATYWPLAPLDSVHPLGNNWGNYQDYGGGPYFHNGIDVITPDVQGRRAHAVRHGWVKGWGTISAELHYRSRLRLRLRLRSSREGILLSQP